MADFDTLTVPDDPYGEGREFYDPVNVWPGASSRVYVSVHRSGPNAIYQLGYDPESDKSWVRSLRAAGEAFSTWAELGAEVAPQT